MATCRRSESDHDGPPGLQQETKSVTAGPPVCHRGASLVAGLPDAERVRATMDGEAANWLIGYHYTRPAIFLSNFRGAFQTLQLPDRSAIAVLQCKVRQ